MKTRNEARDVGFFTFFHICTWGKVEKVDCELSEGNAELKARAEWSKATNQDRITK